MQILGQASQKAEMLEGKSLEKQTEATVNRTERQLQGDWEKREAWRRKRSPGKATSPRRVLEKR